MLYYFVFMPGKLAVDQRADNAGTESGAFKWAPATFGQHPFLCYTCFLPGIDQYQVSPVSFAQEAPVCHTETRGDVVGGFPDDPGKAQYFIVVKFECGQQCVLHQWQARRRCQVVAAGFFFRVGFRYNGG